MNATTSRRFYPPGNPARPAERRHAASRLGSWAGWGDQHIHRAVPAEALAPGAAPLLGAAEMRLPPGRRQGAPVAGGVALAGRVSPAIQRHRAVHRHLAAATLDRAIGAGPQRVLVTRLVAGDGDGDRLVRPGGTTRQRRAMQR